MRYLYGALALGLIMAVSACSAKAQVHAGAGWDQYGLNHLHVALGDVYGAPVGMVPSYIYPDELPVVYLLAREARVSPEIVMALREQGWSWLDIAYHLRVDPYLFVSHLPYDAGYWGWRHGRSYRYLTDRHIIDYVNLAFWATYHRRPVTQIIVIRQRIPSWNYYVVYHRPRIVYRPAPARFDRHTVRRGETPRGTQPERRAQPRDATQQRNPPARPPTRTAERTSPPSRSNERATLPSRTTERASPPSRTSERATLPSRTTERATRPTAQPNRPVTQPNRPVTQPTRPVTQPTRPAAQPTRPSAQPSRPAAQPSRPATQPSRPGARSTRPPAQSSRPPAQRSRPSAQPSRPAVQRSRPAAQPSRPAAQPSRPAARSTRPPAQRSRPSARSSRPAAQQRPTSSRTRDSASSSRRGSGSSAAASRGNRRGN